MNKTLKTLLLSTFVTAAGIGLYEARRASHLQDQVTALMFQQDSLSDQNQVLQQQLDQAAARLAESRQDTRQSREARANLLKLRAAVAKLQGDSAELAQLKATATLKDTDPTESEMRSWLDRVNRLKEHLGLGPEQKIPELQFLTDQDWLAAVRDTAQLKTDADFSQALSALRTSAKNGFAAALQNALRGYSQAMNGQLPNDLSELKPYFASTFDDSVFQRYEMTQPGTVTEKSSPIGDLDDKYFQISLNTISSASMAENTLEHAVQSFAAANGGQSPKDPSQLAPYVTTSAEQAALQKLIPKPASK